MGISNVLRYWVPLGFGASLAACSRTCLAALEASATTAFEAADLLEPGTPRIVDPVVRGPSAGPSAGRTAGPSADLPADPACGGGGGGGGGGHPDAAAVTTALWPHGACTHCGWCGNLASAPGRGCRLHDDRCPPFAWEHTTAGLAAMTEVRRRTGVQEFTPRAMAAFHEVADLQRQVRRFPDLAGLVDGVMDRRVDWLS